MPSKQKTPLANGSAEHFSLSTRGYATVALCPGPACASAPDGSWERLHSERAQWAYSHGLEPVDGAYLSELRRRPLTLSQLGEALAILSQTSQMVEQTMKQLNSLGLIEPTQADAVDRTGPPQQAIEAELSAALDDLQLLLDSIEDEGQLVPRTAGVTLRRAMSRVVAARRFASAPPAPESAEATGSDSGIGELQTD